MIKDKTPYRILVIEDNPGDYHIVEDYLGDQMKNPAISWATNYKQASEMITARGDGTKLFDVILLDLSLTDKQGKELVTDILRIALVCPVIILSGYADIQFSILSLSYGIVDYLIKDDLNPLVLYKSIVYAIERKKNIERLEESERRYSDLFHLSPVPMWVYDCSTSLFLDVNNAAVKQYGYNREEFACMTIQNILPPLHDGNTEKGVFIQGITDDISFRESVTHKTKNGDLIHVAIQSTMITFKGENATLTLANNISERIKYISAIEKQNEALRQIAQIQSHVVRAPLAKMMGIADLIRNLNIATPECIVLLDHFANCGSELDKIIRDISQKSELADIKIS